MASIDGGPAFPRPASEFTKNGTLADGNNAEDAQQGMSLRDYFAAAVIQGLVANLATSPHGFAKPWVEQGKDFNQWAAECAYAMASHLLAIRAARPEQPAAH